jgi:glutathione S-transferase
MMTLYDYALSANGYKVRLLLSMLAVPHMTHFVELYPGRENHAAWFRRINPLAEVPVLDDDGFILRDSHAILVALAARTGSAPAWYPAANPRTLGAITEWLAFAQRLGDTAGAARLHDSLFVATDIDAARAGAHRLLRVLDEHLWFAEQEGQDYLCTPTHPTIADLACFPDIILSEEGAISRQPYPAVRRWCDRIKRLPGFIVMPGVFPAGPA